LLLRFMVVMWPPIMGGLNVDDAAVRRRLRMKNLIRILLVLLSIGMLSACGGGDDPVVVRQLTIYGTTVGFTDPDTLEATTSDLVLLDPDTGDFLSTIGDIGFIVSGLAYDKTTGKLFATTSANDPDFPAGLIEINLVTGAGTPIGAGTGLPAAATLTVDSAGRLYTWSEPTDDDLAIIDKVTGVATVVADSALITQTFGLDFDDRGILYLVNFDGEVFTINPITGAATSIGTIGITAHHGKFHPVTGDYVGIDVADPTVAARNLIVAEFSTFTVDTVPTADFLHTIAFVYH